MPNELEAKMKVTDLARVRARLVELDAKWLTNRREVNAFFDTAEGALLSRDSGLRLRMNANQDGSREVVLTFKGKQIESDGLKNREEIEVVVDDLDRTRLLLSRLGYLPGLQFEKKRESFELLGCRVELDELPPPIGTFVEIEGESKADIDVVRERLGLLDEPLITTGYAGMIDAHLGNNGKGELTFAARLDLVVLVRDLLFSSKVRASAKAKGVNAKIVRDGSKLLVEVAPLLIVSLNEPGNLEHALAWKRKTGGKVLAFASHVAVESIEEARRLGVDRVMSNGGFSAHVDQIVEGII